MIHPLPPDAVIRVTCKACLGARGVWSPATRRFIACTRCDGEGMLPQTAGAA